MQLQPASRGVQSLADSLPHPLSLLQALVPGAGRVRDVSFSTRDPRAERFSLRFRWQTPSAACDVEVELDQTDAHPRRAAYAVDGRVARRVVSPQDYRLCFADAERSVPLPDPLTRLVAAFVTALREGRSTEADPILQRAGALAELVAAYAAEETR
jgi:hypothetical protein